MEEDNGGVYKGKHEGNVAAEEYVEEKGRRMCTLIEGYFNARMEGGG